MLCLNALSVLRRQGRTKQFSQFTDAVRRFGAAMDFDEFRLRHMLPHGAGHAVGALRLPALAVGRRRGPLETVTANPFEVHEGYQTDINPGLHPSKLTESILMGSQVALQLLEEQLDLPTQSVQGDDFLDRQIEVVGQQNLDLVAGNRLVGFRFGFCRNDELYITDRVNAAPFLMDVKRRIFLFRPSSASG